MRNKEIITIPLNKVSYKDLEALTIEQQTQLFVKDKEIERLNNIINEFMEELKWQRKVSLSLNEVFAVSRIDTLINKLQELKEKEEELSKTILGLPQILNDYKSTLIEVKAELGVD